MGRWFHGACSRIRGRSPNERKGARGGEGRYRPANAVCLSLSTAWSLGRSVAAAWRRTERLRRALHAAGRAVDALSLSLSLRVVRSLPALWPVLRAAAAVAVLRRPGGPKARQRRADAARPSLSAARPPALRRIESRARPPYVRAARARPAVRLALSLSPSLCLLPITRAAGPASAAAATLPHHRQIGKNTDNDARVRAKRGDDIHGRGSSLTVVAPAPINGTPILPPNIQ